MLLAEGIEFTAARRRGVLVTLRRDGRPQLSNVMYDVVPRDDVGTAPAGAAALRDAPMATVRMSLTDARAKTRNLRRDPRGSLYVGREDFFAYVVLDGLVELSPVAADEHDAVVEELIEIYRRIAGEHEDWGSFRASMVAEGRVVAHLVPSYAYGIAGG
jgi:PPOX class probable F420-dependent enzyme